eukprot:TRINITY_DN3297_c0_g1_i1.p1 TRINITY_DN3297_c0_g1~~TRINITY_DN3297_c0_g1_i1.p1  ORF type:complete len:405 (+),score=63.98 TRINITY_DN3297_c0_g1_i1:33-1217(+)
MSLRHAAAGDVAEDVIAEIGTYLRLADVRNCCLVSMKWYRAMSSNLVWKEMSRRYFIQLPLLTLSPGVERRKGGPGPAFFRSAAREMFMQKRFELIVHKMDLITQKEVRSQHPYILHALLTMIWFTAVVFVVLLILILEGLCTVTLNQAFNVLHASYAVIIISILFNVIASTHYEPRPLIERMMKHSHLITLTGVSILIIIGFSFITQIFQYNVVSPPDQRMSWVTCFAPILSLLLFWQFIAILAARPQLQAWIKKPYIPSLLQIHVIITTLFPLGFAAAFACLSIYIETRNVYFLIFASMPFLFGTMSVTATFLLDYFAHRKLNDAIAAFSMANLSAFPIGFMLFEPRGLHLLPLLLFITSYVVSYINQWVKKGERQRSLRSKVPYVASGKMR